MFQMNQIIKVIAFCFVTYILIRTIAPFIGENIWELIFGSKKKKNSDLDFDALITQKKAMMRGGQLGADPKALSGKKGRKGETEEIIQSEYQKLSQKAERSGTETKRFEELKKMIKILDSLQWGSIPEVEALEKKLGQSYSHRFSANGPFQTLLSRNAFLDSKANWVGLDKTFLILETYTFTKELFQNTSLQSLLAKRWQMDPLSLQKSLCLLVGQKKGKGTLALLAKTNSIQVPTLNDQEILSLLILAPGTLKNKTTLLNEIKEGAEVFHALSPLPPLKSDKDMEGACKSLGLGPNATIDQIKSRYKKLAQLKHPDTLKAKGIPTEFESIATENFTQIKRAYDILVKGK